MEDRELIAVERRLRGYLSAQLDRVPVRSEPAFAAARPSRLRAAATIPAALLVVVLAAGVGIALADWRSQRAATLEPTAAAAATPPGPLALGGGAPSVGFGFVSTSVNTLLIRNETTEAGPIVIASVLPQVAVSPNGHEIAYWLTTSAPATGRSEYELRHADVLAGGGIAAAASAPSGLLLRAPAGEVPGSFVWSSDGTGLIASTHAPAQRAGQTSAGVPQAHWFAIDIASRRTSELAAAFGGTVSTVYAWDRQRDLVTGSGRYAGGSAFTALQAGRITNSAIPQGAEIAAADIYGRSVVLAYAGGCTGPPANASPRPCPVLETRDQASFAVITSAVSVDATRDFPDVVFRARTQDLVVQLPLTNGDVRVELWGDLGRGPHQVLTSYSPSGRFSARRELILPRIDGSAVFLLKFDDSAGGRWFGDVVGLNPTKGLGPVFERTPFEIRTGGNPLASIVLDAAFAQALVTGAPLTAAPGPNTGGIPKCQPGQTPLIDVASPPPPGPQPGTGSVSAIEAFRRARPNVVSFDMYPLGSDQKVRSSSDLGRGPAWVVAGGETFVVEYLGEPGGNNWFAYPARFLGCRDLPAGSPRAPLATPP